MSQARTMHIDALDYMLIASMTPLAKNHMELEGVQMTAEGIAKISILMYSEFLSMAGAEVKQTTKELMESLTPWRLRRLGRAGIVRISRGPNGGELYELTDAECSVVEECLKTLKATCCWWDDFGAWFQIITTFKNMTLPPNGHWT